jgi:hypothetical protein
LFLLTPVYGGFDDLGYAEPFLTARSFSECFALLSLAFLIREQLFISAILVAVSAAIHPLIAIPCGLVIWVSLCMRDIRWIWASLLGLLPLVLAITKVPPFSDLFITYDEAWLAIIFEPNTLCFPLSWAPRDWISYAFDLLLLNFAVRSVPVGPAHDLLRAVVVVSILCTAFAVVVADGLHDVLLTSLQLWRAQWLSHWLAIASFPIICVQLWRERCAVSRASALLLACGVLCLPSVFSSLAAGILANLLFSFRRRLEISRPVLAVLWIAVLLSALLLTARQVIGLKFFRDNPSLFEIVQSIISLTLVIFALCIAPFFLLRSKTLRPLSLLMALALLLFSILNWDRRTDWDHFRESFPKAGLWEEKIPSHALVYWYGDLAEAWVMLHRATFFSGDDSGGLLFRRQTAIEFQRRSDIVEPIESQFQICTYMNALNQTNDCTPDLESFHDLCIDGPVDFVVIPFPLSIPYVDRTHSKVIVNGSDKDVYLYSCNDLIAKS